eukprot:gene11228-12200_t
MPKLEAKGESELVNAASILQDLAGFATPTPADAPAAAAAPASASATGASVAGGAAAAGSGSLNPMVQHLADVEELKARILRGDIPTADESAAALRECRLPKTPEQLQAEAKAENARKAKKRPGRAPAPEEKKPARTARSRVRANSAMPQAADPADIEVVHIVSMCHLDGGYKYPFIAEVATEWFNHWIPDSIALSRKLEREGGEIQHRWTMNPWIASLFLQCPDNGSWIGKDNGDDSPSSYPLQCPNRTQIEEFKTAVKD